MQGPTHLVTGILIQKIFKKIPKFLYYPLVIILALFFHGILDKLARFTYHPSTPLADDWFWVSYHLVIAYLTIFIFIKYWPKYKLSLALSILPDLDWVLVYASNFFGYGIFWKEPILHRSLIGFLDSLPPFSFLNSLPDWSLVREGAIVEFTCLIILSAFGYAIGKEKTTSTVQKEKDIPSRSNQEIHTFTLADRLATYRGCMDSEQSIRTSYQSLLTSLELAIFGLIFTLITLEPQLQLKLTDYLWVLSVVGIILCMFFGNACEFRARNVDLWRTKIVKLVSGTNLENDFESGKYDWFPLGKVGIELGYLFGHWFERIFIPGMLIIWQTTLWIFPSPLLVRLSAFLASCFWILYAFLMVELKGRIITNE